MPKHKGGKHSNELKNKHNPHQIAKTANQPRRTLMNKVRKLKFRVRMNPKDRQALVALQKYLLQQ